MIDRLLEIIAPHSCCSCGYLGAILCQQCKNDIISEPFAQCLVCLKPTSVGSLCERCRTDGCFTDAWCVGVREDGLKTLLDRYKFDGAREAGRVAATLLEAHLPLLPASLVVVPVPTASAHQRVRGFDHMAVIGTRLAHLRGLSFSEVLATDRTDTQHFKTRLQRQTATTDTFHVHRPVPEDILLVDDIYTTGSTLRACAELLRASGARRISVAVIARQTLDERGDLW